jgi:hypothetical protein
MISSDPLDQQKRLLAALTACDLQSIIAAVFASRDKMDSLRKYRPKKECKKEWASPPGDLAQITSKIDQMGFPGDITPIFARGRGLHRDILASVFPRIIELFISKKLTRNRHDAQTCKE